MPPPGVPGFQRVGPVCHQVHAEGDLQPAAVTAEVAAVCHGGRGGGEQPFPVSTPTFTSRSLLLSLIGWQSKSELGKATADGNVFKWAVAGEEILLDGKSVLERELKVKTAGTRSALRAVEKLC